MLDRMKKFRVQILVLIILEALLILPFVIKFVNTKDTGTALKMEIEGVMKHTDSGYSLTTDDKVEDKKSPVMTLNFGHLDSGTYFARVSYDTDNMQRLTFTANIPEYVQVNDIVLDKDLKEETFYINLTNPVDDFTINVFYLGGSYTFNNLSLYPSRIGAVRGIVAVFLLFSAIEFCLFIYHRYPDKRKKLFYTLLISFIAFLPFLVWGIKPGHDYPYHFLRIDSIAQELKCGHFPVYMQPIWVEGYGSPVSLYYGDLLLYIPALLRIVGFSFNTALKIFTLLITVCTTIFAHSAFQRLFKKEKVSWILTLVYVCAPYRMIDVYVRCAIGEYLVFMFLPLVISGLYGIYTDTAEDRRDWKNTLLLAGGMAGIICSHVLSTEMIGVMLVIVALVLFRKTFKARTLRLILLSIVHCLVLSLFFLVPFLDSYVSNNTVINNLVSEQTAAIQDTGVYVGQNFIFFQDIFSSGQNLDGDRMNLSIGIILIFTVVAAIYLIVRKKYNKRILLYLSMTILSLVLASNLFPWDDLAYYTKIGNLLAQIQFPWRWLLFATAFAVLLLGEIMVYADDNILQEKRTAATIACVIICALSLFETTRFASNYTSESKRKYHYNIYEMMVSEQSPKEYLPYGVELEDLTHETSAKGAKVLEQSREGSSMDLVVRTKDKEGVVSVPIFYYKGYQVRDEAGNALEVTPGDNKEITFKVPAKYEGKIHVAFEAPWYWTAAQVTSLVYLLLLCCISKIRSVKEKKND